MVKSIIIIPSRLAAKRLPNKPLININNKSLIMHVYEKAIKSKIGNVYVATCDKKIALEVKKHGGKYIMTSSLHSNGTERVHEASQKLNLKDTDYVINVQGDEPMIDPSDIKNLSKLSIKNKSNFSTLAHKINNKNDYKNQNIVKVTTKKKISNKSIVEALNFCRKMKLTNSVYTYHHYGIYLYKLSILKKFIKLKKSKNEAKEKLEQLRALDNDLKINVIMANYFSGGIDTKKDLEEYKKILNNK